MAFDFKKLYRRNPKLTVASGALIVLAYLSGELRHVNLSSALWILACIVGGFDIARSAGMFAIGCWESRRWLASPLLEPS